MSRLPAALMLALATLTLAACTDAGPEPQRAVTVAATAATTLPPTASASTTTAPSPSAAPTRSAGPDQDMTTPPQPPAALVGAATEDNAKAVARYFLSLVPYVFATGDLSTWDQLSGPECSFCDSIASTAKEIHGKGNHGTGGALELNFTSAFALEDGRFVVGIEYLETPSRTVASDGSVVEDFPDTYSMKANFELRRSSSSWVVDGVEVDEWAGKQ